MQQVKTKLLNDGNSVPTLAFGTVLPTAHGHGECSDAIVLALQKGFRHLDTAHGYENEKSIGIALKKWGGKREDVFITSKWGFTQPQIDHDPEAQLQNSLEQMGVDYLDLFLIHIPNPQSWTNVDAWKKMEEFKERGLVRSIGVSNFSGDNIEEIAKVWKVAPAVNQLEVHPYTFHDPRMIKAIETCHKYDIAVSPFTVLAPITRFPGGPIDEVVTKIAEEKGIAPAQVLYAWSSQHAQGGLIVTTSNKEWQYQQILDSANIVLTEEEVKAVDDAGRRGGIKSRYTLNDPAWN